MIQWHPLFVRLLRPVLEDYYELETNVAVGDVPREADVLLLRRADTAEPHFEDKAAAALVVGDPDLQKSCGSLLPALHPGLLEEIINMAKTKWPKPDFEPLIQLIQWMGGMEAVIKKMGVKRIVDQVGLKRVVDEVGVKRVVGELGLDELLASLSPAQRRALKQRLAKL